MLAPAPELSGVATASRALTTRQAEILALVERVYTVTGEGVGCRYLARRLEVQHSSVRDHLAALYRKGWLRAPTSPAVPARPFLARRDQSD